MTAYLFDTDAVSEIVRKRPSQLFLEWLSTIPLEVQYISSVSVGELYKGAYRSPAKDKYLRNIEEHLLPRLTILPYDIVTAKTFGVISAELEGQGLRLADADLQIAATAIQHNLELVTGNLKHFARIGDLKINTILADNRI